MTTDFCLEVLHRIHYSNKEPVPIHEIASSLVALERILQRLPKTLSAVTTVQIEHMDIYVEEIQTGSLIEDIVLKLFFRNQEELDEFLTRIRESLGQKKVTRNVLIGSIVLVLVGYGLYKAASAMQSPEAAKAININNNVIINIGADQANLQPEQLAAIVESAITDKKGLARDAVAFVKPAKRDTSASITMENMDVLSIPSDIVQKAPSTLQIEDEPTERSYPDVDLSIRATNLDSKAQGWAGLIPGLIDRRVKVVLGAGVAPTDLAGKFSVRADVVVSLKPTGSKKEIKPYMITVVRIIEK